MAYVPGGDLLAHRPHPAGELLRLGLVGLQQRGLHPVDVVGVHEPGLAQLLGGAGELGEHEGAVVLVAAGDVLLGDEVHPVAVGGDDHDVGGAVERGHLGAGERGVEVGDRRAADAAEVAVEAADEAVDVVAQLAVLLDTLAGGHRDLDEDHVLDVELGVAQQLAEGAQPGVDALGVVEPVDAEHDLLRIAELLADLLGALVDALVVGHLVEADEVDRDRERGRVHGAPVGEIDQVAMGLVAHALADQADEVLCGLGKLEADQVGTEEALEELSAPGDLLEELGRRERDVQVEADAQVGAELAQHLRDQLELVVLDPDGGALGGDLGTLLGEPLVDPLVAVPPLAVELRLGHDVVVERPQGAVGEALVVLLDVLGAHRHRQQMEPVVLERLEVLVGATGPADPDAVVGPQDRFEGADQASWGASPRLRAVRHLHSIDGEPIGHDYQVSLHISDSNGPDQSSPWCRSTRDFPGALRIPVE